LFKYFGFLILLFALCAPIAQALEVPPLAGKRLHDQAGVLSELQRQTIAVQLADFEKNTSNQVAILIIDTLEGDPIESFSLRVAEKWKIGQKGKDNGLLITIAVRDRKYRFEVGYGLEGVLPDGLTGSIGREFFRPNFRKGDYYTGISQALEAIFKATKGEYKPAPKNGKSSSSADDLQTAIVTLLIALGLINFVGNKFLGSLIGLIEGLIFTAIFWPTFTVLIIGGIVGLIIGWSIASSRRSHGETPYTYWSTGSGFGSGGGSSDFFSGGGGDFGGGGASGDW
jgi:uncharacterized protein